MSSHYANYFTQEDDDARWVEEVADCAIVSNIKAKDFSEFCASLGMTGDLADKVYAKVRKHYKGE